MLKAERSKLNQRAHKQATRIRDYNAKVKLLRKEYAEEQEAKMAEIIAQKEAEKQMEEQIRITQRAAKAERVAKNMVCQLMHTCISAHKLVLSCSFSEVLWFIWTCVYN